MSGFVVCQSCGTRIKAGRGHCLKCFALLPDPEVPPPTPLSESLGLSRNAAIAVWVGAALAAVLLAVVIWQTWPVPGDEVAQPAGALTPGPPPPAPATPAPESTAAASAEPTAAAGTQPAAGAEVAGGAAADPDLEATRADYEQKLASRPKDPDLLNKLGLVLQKMGRPSEAAARFDRAVALMPLEPTYRFNLARAAGELGQWDRAIDQYRETVRLRPKDYEALSALGLALQKKGDDQTAITELTRARKVNPAGPDAALGLATSLEKVGRVDEAIEVFHQYLDIQPNPTEGAKVRAHLALLSRGRSQVK